MYVLEIIPLSKTAPPDPLSYRSSVNVAIGTLIQVPLRKKTVPGLVVGSVPVREAKAMLKSAHFSLSKSLSDKGVRLPASCIAAAKKIAAYHATTLGAVLSALIIPVLTGEDESLTDSLPKRLQKGDEFQIQRIESPILERLAAYEKIEGTTMLVVPTLAEVSEWSEFLKDQKPVVLTGKVTAKRREKLLGELVSGESSASVLITTPSFAAGLAALVPKLSHVVLERVSAGSYLLLQRPYLDVRIALEALATERALSLTYGDYPLPLEFRCDSSDKNKARNCEKPLAVAPRCTPELFDARMVPGSDEDVKREWHAVPLPLVEQIKEVLEHGGRAAVLAARRGYAPVVICRDCGTAVTDERGRNLSLATENGKRVFRSADGQTTEIIQDKKVLCKNCGSWNLMPLGVGIERVEEELKAVFPKAELVRIDADSSSARAFATKRQKMSEQSEHGTLIIGTELMIPWLSVREPIDVAVVASADSLLALPFWRSRERFVRVGLMLAERSKRLIVATRLPEEVALTALTSPTSSHFWKEESALRTLLHYPPFGTLIVIHTDATRTQLDLLKKQIRTICEEFISTPLLELPERGLSKSLFRATYVLHLPSDAWPNTKLAERLSLLPPNIRVIIDAESFW